MIPHVGRRREFSQGRAVWEQLREGRLEQDPGGGGTGVPPKGRAVRVSGSLLYRD